jgi:membrane protein required for colicin V production
MNWIDILVLLVIALSMLSGFMAGFARVGVGFIATLLGIFFGFWCYGVVAAYVLDYVSSKAIANLVGFFAIFIGMVLIGAVAGRLLAKFFKWVGLSWFDRILGGAFGLVRGIVMAAALITVLLAFAPQPPPRSVVESKTMPYVIDASNILAALTPREVKEAFQETKDKVKKIWSEQTAKPTPEVRHE